VGGCFVAQLLVTALAGDQVARQFDYFIMAGVVAYGVVRRFFMPRG
jgi:hypothetical protein